MPGGGEEGLTQLLRPHQSTTTRETKQKIKDETGWNGHAVCQAGQTTHSPHLSSPSSPLHTKVAKTGPAKINNNIKTERERERGGRNEK
jgi:hypothetical protein